MECHEMDQIIVEEEENAPCLSGLESHMEEAEGVEPHIDETAKDATMDLNMVEATKSTNMNPSAVETAVGNMSDDPTSKELVPAGEDATMEPVLGMSFDSYAEAEKFYYDYAKHVGFGTRIKSTSRSKKTKEINHVVICCNKEGFKAPKRFTAYSKPITRIGCDAMEEVYGTFDCYNIERTKTDGHCSTYILKERVFDKDGNIVGSKEFEVMASEPAAEVQCLCRLFQYKGFLCRHALYVLNHIGVHEIPNHYILPRWRKDFKRIHALQNHSDIVVPISEAQRYDNLYQMFIHLVEEGSLSVDHYKVAVRGIAELVEKILYGAESHNGFVGNYTDNSIDGNQYNEVNLTFTPMMNSCVMNDPLRMSWPFHLDDGLYGSVETNTSNKKRCSKCGKLGHNKKTCKEVGGVDGLFNILNYLG
ncbi:FAR1-RELATED SEQUENCE 6 protein [Nymphaea thermarum]|nr:FAR1-RELATED SEQUENCE 6 protein [Nymphaea thermarum]